jgi:Ca-activated chloride channel family protein
MFAYKKGPEDGYFLMLMTPKFNDKPASDQVIAKDMAFTIDHSGSMAGVKLQQAKDALTFCVNRLMPADFFNIVVFDDALTSNAQDLVPATGENIPSALQYIQAIAVGNNTDIAQALTASLSKIKTSDRPHYLIFLTDGQPTAGVIDNNQISALVNAANVNNTRIFSVGFGYDVNTVLIDKISIDNNGYPLYCNPGQNIEEVISDLYKRIEAPILTSPAISVISIDNSVATYGISPIKLPDLFEGSEIAVYGRYHGQGKATVALSGLAGGKVDTMTFTADFPDSAIDYAFVPRLWATQQIARLMTRIKLQTLTQESLTPLVDSVKVLSLAYGIVTPYTSQLFVPASGTGGSWAGALQTSNGRSANDASNAMQGMQQNSNAAQSVVADTNAVPYAVAPQTNQIQNASNKVFIYASNSIWMDASFDSTKPADTLYYGSDAYFTLAAQSSDLVDLMAVGNQTAFNYQGQNYLILDKNAVSPVVPDLFGPMKQALKTMGFNVTQRGPAMVFTGLSGVAGGCVTVYSAQGTVIAKIPTQASENSVQWDARKTSGNGLIAGAYVAVYKNNGATHVKKFMVLR